MTALLLAGAWSLAGQSVQPKTYEVTFAQLTDSHIFDDGGEGPADAMRQAANDRSALSWAVDQINRSAEAGTKIDFIVYTGDFGLRNVTFGADDHCDERSHLVEPEDGLPPSTLTSALNEVLAELNRLDIKTVFFVAGNNDLALEDVTDKRFDCFMKALKARAAALPTPVTVKVLCADHAEEINGIRIAGLNTASFKKIDKYAEACSDAAKVGGDRALQGACPKPQIESLRKLVESDANAPLILFTHVPDLIDPHFHKDYPSKRKSSWDIPKAVREVWEQEVCKPNVLGMFAGHFHDSASGVYGSNVTTQDLTYSGCVAKKTWIAPPLALKFQERHLAKARGFLMARVAEGKVADVRVKWLEGESSKTTGSQVAELSSPIWSQLAWLGGVGVIAALLSVLGHARLRGRRLPAEWSDQAVLGYARLRDWAAFSAGVACVALTLAIISVARSQLGVTERATIALLLGPLLFYCWFMVWRRGA